jgi:hypothetical protein
MIARKSQPAPHWQIVVENEIGGGSWRLRGSR